MCSDSDESSVSDGVEDFEGFVNNDTESTEGSMQSGPSAKNVRASNRQTVGTNKEKHNNQANTISKMPSIDTIL